MWLAYAFLSAGFAALVAIFGKVGLKSVAVDPTVATAVRGVIMAVFLVVATGILISLQKIQHFSLSGFTGKEWMWIVLSGIAGALSWIFYFVAFKTGNASQVAAIDRLSIVFVVILAGLFLGEDFGPKVIIGAILISLGAVFIAVPQLVDTTLLYLKNIFSIG